MRKSDTDLETLRKQVWKAAKTSAQESAKYEHPPIFSVREAWFMQKILDNLEIK